MVGLVQSSSWQWPATPAALPWKGKSCVGQKGRGQQVAANVCPVRTR